MIALTKVLDNLNHNMSEITSTANQVMSGSESLTQSADHLAYGSSNQASAVEELYASITLIEDKTNLSATLATEAETLANKSNVQAINGTEHMQAMIVSMRDIKDASSNISRIIKVIEDIAFQTNMLALNAAVEAARAGAQGTGFAVVAEEVRSLASESQAAVQETTELIEDSIYQVNSGTSNVQGTADSLDGIVNSVTLVTKAISEISYLASEQANALGDISKSIKLISDIVQSNAATSEECAAVATEFNSQAQTLTDLVAFYKLKR